MSAYPSGANGRARVDPRRPSAFAICDRCGFRYNRTDLKWQFDWRGAQLQNLRILVCERCEDVPQEQLRSYSPPADPLPVRDPRSDLSVQGNAPLVVTTVACVPSVALLDTSGGFLLDTEGNQLFATGGTYQTVLAADPTRSIVDFALPASFGLFINPTGGVAGPLAIGSEFYAPGSAYTARGTAAQPALTIFTTVAGLQIVVETQ